MTTATTTARSELTAVLVTKRDAAKICGIGTSTLDRYRCAGYFPQPVRIGTALRWRVDELMTWIEEGCPRERPQR